MQSLSRFSILTIYFECSKVFFNFSNLLKQHKKYQSTQTVERNLDKLPEDWKNLHVGLQHCFWSNYHFPIIICCKIHPL